MRPPKKGSPTDGADFILRHARKPHALENALTLREISRIVAERVVLVEADGEVRRENEPVFRLKAGLLGSPAQGARSSR